MDKGVTYIKINRIDAEGNDNTLTLQELTNIRIRYSDVGIINYPIYTISEYPDYYLYQVFTTNVTSSTDNSILDYTFEAFTSSISVPFNIDVPPTTPIPLTEVMDAPNYYNGNTYTLQNTSNIELIISASGTSSIGAPLNFQLFINKNSQSLAGSAQLGGGPFSASYRGYFQTGDNIYLSYNAGPGETLTNVSFTITQSISPTSSLNQVVLEPYITENFELSDCNVLYGNVDSYPFNSLYMDVDYSTNGMIAINTNQIISGSATRSTVKPYYYSLERHINPRYNGSENIDPGTWYFGSILSIAGLFDAPAQYQLNGFRSSNFKVGDKIKIYQPEGILKGEIPIYAIRGNRIFVLQSQINLSLSIAGVVSLVDNYFENSTTFPLDTFNSSIFEYKYGNTTFPEIPNAGMLVMGNILEVADKDNVNILRQGSPFFEAYNKTINDTFVPNASISDIRQYGDGKQVTLNNLQVLTSEFGTPISPQNTGDVVEYWIPTNDAGSNQLAKTDEFTIEFLNGGAYEIELNELGQYITASSGLIPSHSIINNITASLARGDRWFATVYNTLPNPLNQTSLSPYQGYALEYTPSNDPVYPLLYHGVYEIISGSIPSSQLILQDTITRSPLTESFGNGNKGLIIWKAITPSPKQGKYIIVSKPNVNDLGPGAIVLPDSNEAINQYFNEITTTYGSNTKPPTNQSIRGSFSGT